MRNNGRCRHIVWGAETSGRGWRGAGVDNVQVNTVPLRERSWRAGERESARTTNGYMGGGRREEGKK